MSHSQWVKTEIRPDINTSGDIVVNLFILAVYLVQTVDQGY